MNPSMNKKHSFKQQPADYNNSVFSNKQTFHECVSFVYLQSLQTNKFQTQINQMKKIQTTFKDIKTSQKLRKKGNTMYKLKNNDYIKSTIICYTKSVAYAPLGSTELSLAYANRSAVLFKARLYNDCLLDIERALKSGYPDHLKIKLYIRQLFCFHILMPSSTIESSISIANIFQWFSNMIHHDHHDENYNIAKNMIINYSNIINKFGKLRILFDFNKNFPIQFNDNAQINGATDAIELKKNKNIKYIIAARDIKPGEFIFAEKSFAKIIDEDKRYELCWHCSVECFSGIPCERCQNIIYCSFECRDTASKEYHDIECPILNILLSMDIDIYDQLAAKIFIKMFKRFKSLNQFKNYIDTLKSPASSVKTSDKFDGSQYETYHSLNYSLTNKINCSWSSVETAVLIALAFATNTDIFGKKLTLKRFLKNKNLVLFVARMILKYSRINEYNMFSNIYSVLPFNKIIHHSCDPNIDMTFYNSTVSLCTIKPIKKGQQIVIAKGYSYYYSYSKNERQILLFQHLKNPCNCIACTKNWPVLANIESCKTILKAEQYNYMMQQIVLFLEISKKKNKQKIFKLIEGISQVMDTFYKKLPENIPYHEIISLQILLVNIIKNLSESTILND